MSDFQKELNRVRHEVKDPNIGFVIPFTGRRVINPLVGKESGVRKFINDNELSQFDTDGSLSNKLSSSAPNDWNEIAEDFASRAASGEATRVRAKNEALSDRQREFSDTEAYETRKQARDTAAQRALLDKQGEMQRYAADSSLKGVGMQVGGATKQAEIQAAAAARQAEISGRYSLEGQRVAGQYGLEGQKVAGMYGLEGARIGANASIRQSEIGAQSARDVANISGGWSYRNTDLSTGRQLQDSREQRGSEERKQTQNLLAARQAQGQQMRREEASELLNARLQRGDSGRNFLLQAVGQKQWFR